MKIYLPLIFLFLSINSKSQLLIDNFGYTPNQLVTQLLITDPSITISNVTFVGDSNQIGFFNSLNANVGLDSGIIMSTGKVDGAIGPNDEDGYTDFFLSPYADNDLNNLANNTGNDVVILEFDFVPNGNVIEFNYVFGSEEYLEFVNSGVNDAFGFFLSGPGIVGAFSNNAKNIAVVPGTNTYITIDNVNSTTNSNYYRDNGDGISGPQTSDPTFIQMDGLTTKLSATSNVICGEEYHIKIALADMGDDWLDSEVFLEAGSFSLSKTNISYPFHLPNIFTPNNDGINDIFKPVNGSFLPTKIQFDLYNRWGLLVYSSQDPMLNWDGKTNDGKDLLDGDYYYLAKLFFESCGGDTHTEEIKGCININR